MDTELSQTPIDLNKVKVEASNEGRQAFENYFRRARGGMVTRILRKARSVVQGNVG